MHASPAPVFQVFGGAKTMTLLSNDGETEKAMDGWRADAYKTVFITVLWRRCRDAQCKWSETSCFRHTFDNYVLIKRWQMNSDD